ncbi:hypothetical protein QE152_g23712 [Popillia japonica]|uniref:Uncharacterized protein n=1 Tax=Popillia japonica TaxID=7064 RepID=A0AAW1KDM1_POPJA
MSNKCNNFKLHYVIQLNNLSLNTHSRIKTDSKHPFPQYTFPNQNRFQTPKPTSFKFAKTPGQQLDRRQQRQQPMEVDPSTSRIRNRTTPFGPSAPETKWTSEELHQQEQWEEENQEQYEYQPEWDDPAEPFGWEVQEEQDFPTGASAEEPPPQNNPN